MTTRDAGRLRELRIAPSILSADFSRLGTQVEDVMAAGASGIAVIAAIFGASDPEAAARSLRRAIGRS